MPLLVVGVNHHTASLQVRERFALSREQGEEMLDRLAEYVPHAAVLPTCNRTELYVTAHNTAIGAQHLQRFLADWSGIGTHALTSYLYVQEQWDAVRHLFRVAAGLDSMVLGEEQILGQVRGALEAAAGRGAVDAVLQASFRRALRAGRRVRAETGISRNAVSVSSVAVQLARQLFGSLDDVRVLVISAGEVGKLTTRSLAAQGVRQLQVVSRGLDRAQALAERMGGTALPWSELDSGLAQADLVITATGAPERVLTSERIEGAIAHRPGRKLLIIDIAVPRDVDPEAATLPGVSVYNLDDIQSYSEKNHELRALEVGKAEAILAYELGKFKDWWEQREVVPTISALRHQADAIRDQEVQRTLARMPGLNAGERARIEAMSKAIVKKLLHRPLVSMKERRDGEGSLEAVRELFGLEEPAALRGPTPPAIAVDGLCAGQQRLPDHQIAASHRPAGSSR